MDKAGTKVYVVSRKEFDAINEASDPVGFRKIMQDGDRIGGFYDVNRNAIVLPSDASTTGLQEEFGHAFMLPIINGQANPELQQELFNELTNNIKQGSRVMLCLDLINGRKLERLDTRTKHPSVQRGDDHWFL